MTSEEFKSALQAVATGEGDKDKRIDTLIEALKTPPDSPEVGVLIESLENTRTRTAKAPPR